MGRQKADIDTNSVIAGLLRDLAAIQTSKQSKWGYARAAEAIQTLSAPIETLLQPDGTLRKIANVGPSSTRVILEVLRTGASPTAEHKIAESGKAAEVEKSRSLRGTFLSRAQVVAALRNQNLHGPSLEDYRGDLQMHSTYSDGSQTLEVIVQTAIARGYEYAAVTDHSYGLPIANGVTMARLAEQHREIDRLNADSMLAGRFRLIKGIEANVLADGTVDMTPEELSGLELVVAAPHSALRSSADQTRRILTAVRTPGIHILGHPRGRKYGVRPGVTADWDRVFAAAARTTVAIEIDGDPRRQDIDHELAARALAAGCIFALDSDAHAPEEWEFAETAIAHARLAQIPPERVINYWPLEFLLEWASSRLRS
ncbi:MAG TPA: DNA polymerase/3'-5' exonuclease PolX [Vicinamibacterales bacterium]|nr:DNA polymerase/3'-5' exonuclease PolX [Vicinamibacterales bacterium]